jgi:hypothetical protein
VLRAEGRALTFRKPSPIYKQERWETIDIF